MYAKILIVVNFFTVSVLCLTADEIEAERSGWSTNPNTQYHIQTDEGPERYFRFQTLNGQYRKEKRLADGTVIGTEGWLDPLGYLRIKDYIADREGFRILKSKMVFVGKDRPIQDAVADAKKVPAQTGILARPRRPPNPFRRPEAADVAPLSGNDIGYYTTATPRADVGYYYTQNRGRFGPGSSGLQSSNSYPRSRNGYRPQIRPSQSLEAPINVYDSTAGSSTARPNYRAVTSVPVRVPSSNYEFPPYDGTHTTANGFQYYLKRQYHEEEREPTGDSVGSFGYIDPFGIRRVIYYKTDPYTGGFVHKKNNRYVGFNATPYDPDRVTRRRDTSAVSTKNS